MVAQKLELEGGEKCDLVSPRTAASSTRLQLAQYDRFLVRCAFVSHRDLGGGDLVYMGGQSRLSRRRRNTAGTARESTTTRTADER